MFNFLVNTNWPIGQSRGGDWTRRVALKSSASEDEIGWDEESVDWRGGRREHFSGISRLAARRGASGMPPSLPSVAMQRLGELDGWQRQNDLISPSWRKREGPSNHFASFHKGIIIFFSFQCRNFPQPPVLFPTLDTWRTSVIPSRLSACGTRNVFSTNQVTLGKKFWHRCSRLSQLSRFY